MTPDADTLVISNASINPATTYLISIHDADSQVLVRINMNGTMEFGPNYHPDAAAKIFWDAIERFVPNHLRCGVCGGHVATTELTSTPSPCIIEG